MLDDRGSISGMVGSFLVHHHIKTVFGEVYPVVFLPEAVCSGVLNEV